MVCQIRYLSSAGIHPREKKGVAALAQAFPSDWLVFASLTAFPKNSSPIEIDLLVVMDDRIVLLELKDWNGPLEQKGDLWIHVKKRERSPVVLGNEKAKKIKSLFGSQISQFRTYVDSRVVLTASSTRDLLSEHEKPFVLTLDEAVRLGDREERNRLLGKVKISSVKPNMRVKDFDRILGNSSYFQPSKMLWDGFWVSVSVSQTPTTCFWSCSMQIGSASGTTNATGSIMSPTLSGPEKGYAIPAIRPVSATESCALVSMRSVVSILSIRPDP